MTMKHKILLVEDDANLGFVLKDNLTLRGYEVILCSDGKEAIQTFKPSSFQVCLVDVMLPYIDGFSVAKYIRGHDKEVPILFLTAKGMTDDKLEGFRAGGDDYITKPFSFEELFFRIEVFLRRRKPLLDTRSNLISLGSYLFDANKLTLTFQTHQRTLTQREGIILELLCRHLNTTLKREEILNQVWGDDDYFMGRSLDVFISKLRKYLQQDSTVQIINHHGVGFCLGIKAGKRLYLNWYVTNKAYSRQMLPKDLITLFSDGNASLVNGTSSFAPQFEGLAYLESAWGASYIVNDQLTFGGRIKLLRGVFDVTTENTEITMSLDENYATTVNAQVNVKTSGIQSMDEVDFANDYKNYLKNKGLALDLGATLKLTDELTVGASLLDIGYINWQHDTYAYTLDKADASYTFQGIDLQKVLDGDEDYLDAEMDSIESKFELQEGAIGSYRTPLPGKMYLTASYAWKANTTFGALLFFEKYQGRFYPGFSTSVHKEFGRIAGASISYTAINRTFGNFGLGFNLNLTPFQFYVVGDNLLRIPTSHMINGSFNKFASNTQYLNVRAGLNFIFGRVLPEDKKAYNSRKK